MKYKHIHIILPNFRIEFDMTEYKSDTQSNSVAKADVTNITIRFEE